LKAVLDTCVLKLATLPNANNAAALIAALAAQERIELWASRAMLDEYAAVLADEPEVLALIQGLIQPCYPLSPLRVIRHEPDNRLVECALAVNADYLITVNTARGHFDRKRSAETRVVTPGEFLGLAAVQSLLRTGDEPD
jgi:predicted nucleic acid-binding protein